MKFFLFLLLLFSSHPSFAQEPARIGSKIFTEAYILSEILAQKLESKGFPVIRKSGLGATGVTEEAMRSKNIDLIVDYSGAIIKAFLKSTERMSIPALRQRLEPLGYTISNPLGFNNTYALAVRPEWAKENNVKKISDLQHLKNIKAAFTPEFTSREENWPRLKSTYNFNQFIVNEMDHQLAYQAVYNKKVDVMEAYSTDAKLKEYQLQLLLDDKNYFPNYQAVIMTTLSWVQKNPDAWAALQELAGTIPEEKMIELNSMADLEKKNFPTIAREFLHLVKQSEARQKIKELWLISIEHLNLVFIPVFMAILLGIPFGYVAYKFPLLHTPLASLTTILQTIPSLALLTLLIPLTGIGTISAMIVLFIYALLPIFLNSFEGFTAISPQMHLSASTLRLKSWFKFRWIELPLAMPQIFTGIQTALITTVATATLAALIGAGGYGKKIIAGLAVNDLKIVLAGSIPCAMMAIIMQMGCNAIARKWIRNH